jgi:hypothetical protein
VYGITQSQKKKKTSVLQKEEKFELMEYVTKM